MIVKVNHAAKRCEIWVNHHEKATYAQSEEYRETTRRYRAQGYRVCVFFGGNEPIAPGVAALRDHQHDAFF